MKFQWDKKYLYWGITAFCVIALSIVFYYVLFHPTRFLQIFSSISKTCAPIISGLVLAYLLTPICSFFENYLLIPLYKKCNLNIKDMKPKKRIRGLAILLTLFVVIYLLYIFFSIVLKEIISSIQSIVLQFPIYIKNLEKWIDSTLSLNQEIESFANNMLDTYYVELNDWLNNSLLPQVNVIVKEVSLSLISVAKGLWNLIIGLIVSVYVLFSKEQFAGQSKKIIYAFFPKKKANEIISDIRYANKTFGAYVSGKIIDSIIIGFLCFFLMKLLKINYPILISVIIGITNVIPFFGPFIGAIPSILLILLINPFNGIKFLILIILLQAFDGNILGPKILGDSTGLSSFWVIFSITIFGAYFGVVGMAVGVPIFALIYAAFKRKVNRNLISKHLPINTLEYHYLNRVSEDDNSLIPLTEEEKRNSRKAVNKNNKSKSIFKFGDKSNQSGNDQ
ncbi:MAG: AI-2E family transporter [Lachnospiraceae bacterium]|nr:AI-2E family transporter [Lachnospiraceae bacterium]